MSQRARCHYGASIRCLVVVVVVVAADVVVVDPTTSWSMMESRSRPSDSSSSSSAGKSEVRYRRVFHKAHSFAHGRPPLGAGPGLKSCWPRPVGCLVAAFLSVDQHHQHRMTMLRSELMRHHEGDC